MKQLRLLTSGTTALFFHIFCLFYVQELFAEEPQIAPTHEVHIQLEKKDNPQWKHIWDKARIHARAEEYDSAKKSYYRLLELKPNITEAKWELCKLLLMGEQWDESVELLKQLLDTDPHNNDYLMAAGKAALQNNHYQLTIQYFGQIYESEPFSESSEDAIKGMIHGFKKLNNFESAFLLLEQYYKRAEDKAWLLPDLAGIALKLEKFDKARFYASLLVKSFPENKEYLHLAVKAHEIPEVNEKTLEYWKLYLQLDENYIPYHEKISNYWINKNRPEQALPHLVKQYTLDHLSTILAAKIGDIYYKNLKRLDKALLYYEQYTNVFPDNKRINRRITSVRKTLAEEYMPIVENGGASILWNDLDHVTLNREVIFTEMIDLLTKKGKYDLIIELLKILSRNDTDNLGHIYRIAKGYLKLGDRKNSIDHLYFLREKKFVETEYLLLLSEILIENGDEAEGLRILLEYVTINTKDSKNVEKAIVLSGSLGMIPELYEARNLVNKDLLTFNRYLELQVKYIEALRYNGFFDEAAVTYDQLLNGISDEKQRISLLFHKSDTLILQNRIFEAEQLIRQVLITNRDVEIALERLAKVGLKEKRFTTAQSWFELLLFRKGIESVHDIRVFKDQQLHFFLVDLLIQQQEYNEASDRILRGLSIAGISGEKDDNSFQNKSEKYLSRIYFLAGKNKKCFSMIKKLCEKEDSAEIYVFYDLLSRRMYAPGQMNTECELPSLEKLPFADGLQRAKMYKRYGYQGKALNITDSFLKRVPESVNGLLLKAEILSALSRNDESLDIINTLVKKFPDQHYFTRILLELEYKSGNFQQIVKKVKDLENDELQSEKGRLQDDFYVWKKLLLARSLWAGGQRQEALNIYDSLIAVPIDSMFLEKVEVEKINLHLPPLKKSFWNKITFTQPKSPDPITTVMAPDYVAKNIGKPVEGIAAEMYGEYRWQKLVEKERAARQAVAEKDFFKAEKEYVSLIKEEQSQDTLFDLASIYNLFGHYGKEAELYEIMKKHGPLYPGLDEYIQVNTLKRQPRLFTTFMTHFAEGRDGYINMKKRIFGIEGWLMPSYDQEFAIGLFRNSYSSSDGEDKIWSNHVNLNYSTYFENSMDLNIEFGLNKQEDIGSSEFIYKFELKGRLSDNFEGYGRFEQDIVEDNIQSIEDSIIYRDFETGGKFDVFPRLFVGGDYRYRDYSDDNTQNRLKLWSMYHLFGEINQLKIKYSYEYIDNEKSNIGLDQDFITFKENDIVYWSPDEYWRHQFTIHLKHIFERNRKPSSLLNYGTFEYSYGYGDKNEQSHQFDINIFLEMNRHFLLKSNFSYDNGEDYKDTEATISLIYRW